MIWVSLLSSIRIHVININQVSLAPCKASPLILQLMHSARKNVQILNCFGKSKQTAASNSCIVRVPIGKTCTPCKNNDPLYVPSAFRLEQVCFLGSLDQHYSFVDLVIFISPCFWLSKWNWKMDYFIKMVKPGIPHNNNNNSSNNNNNNNMLCHTELKQKNGNKYLTNVSLQNLVCTFAKGIQKCHLNFSNIWDILVYPNKNIRPNFDLKFQK